MMFGDSSRLNVVSGQGYYVLLCLMLGVSVLTVSHATAELAVPRLSSAPAGRIDGGLPEAIGRCAVPSCCEKTFALRHLQCPFPENY